MLRHIEQSDQGCGGGGGKDNADVFRLTGLTFITNANAQASQSEGNVQYLSKSASKMAPYSLWSKVVHYKGNRVPFQTQIKSRRTGEHVSVIENKHPYTHFYPCMFSPSDDTCTASVRPKRALSYDQQKEKGK